MTPSARISREARSGARSVMAIDDDERWQAVVERDRSEHDSFVYAVRTTGIYCRPTCSARRPLRENAAVFVSWTLAEEASYRSCKRCRPDLAEPDPMAIAIRRACALIQTAEQEPDLATLARDAGYSPAHFQRLFKAAAGLTRSSTPSPSGSPGSAPRWPTRRRSPTRSTTPGPARPRRPTTTRAPVCR